MRFKGKILLILSKKVGHCLCVFAPLREHPQSVPHSCKSCQKKSKKSFWGLQVVGGFGKLNALFRRKRKENGSMERGELRVDKLASARKSVDL